jgi:hypothetical protein
MAKRKKGSKVARRCRRARRRSGSCPCPTRSGWEASSHRRMSDLSGPGNQISGIVTRPPSCLELESALPREAGEGAASVETVMSLSADSVSDKARSRDGAPGSTAVGRKTRVMRRRSGAKCARRASAARSALSQNGPRRLRLAEKADQSALARTPSARSIAKLMTLARDDLSNPTPCWSRRSRAMFLTSPPLE